jgi:hypothetical protein
MESLTLNVIEFQLTLWMLDENFFKHIPLKYARVSTGGLVIAWIISC